MKRLLVVVGVFVVVGLPGNVFGAGFALIEQSVKGLGTSVSGGSAVAEDASTVFFNPAGMTRIEGRQTLGGLHVIFPSTKFKSETAQNVLGTSLGTDDGPDGGVTGVVPNLYYVETFDKGWSFGLGVNAPFGLATEYNKTWVGRYHAVESAVKTININPSAAHKLNDKFSYGFGLNVQYIDAVLSQMIDYGLAAAPGSLDSNPNADVFSELTADDWSLGYNLGFLFEPSDKTRFGFAYRSEVKHELEGDAAFQIMNPAFLNAVNPALLAGAQAQFVNQGAYGKIELPANASLSLVHELNPDLSLMADVTWTGWSSFDKLVINFEGTLASTPSVTTENWDDTMRYSVGGTYKPTEDWVLRAGVAYDETPIPDAEHRTPRIPGTDRTWLSLGAGHTSGPWNFDFAFVHLFIEDSKINKDATATAEDQGRGTLVGEFENSVEIVSAEVSYSF